MPSKGNGPACSESQTRSFPSSVAALPLFALDRLSRYEHLLWRQARQIVFTLESLRRRKRQTIRSSFPFSFRRREPGSFSEELTPTSGR